MAKRYPVKKYQIWIGNYNLGQGFSVPTEAQLVGTAEAPNFRVACLMYELQQKLEIIQEMIEDDSYIDHQDCRWFYDFDTNRNSWTGKYYETEEEAQKSFK